jgi:hypothetical protein
MKDEIDQDTKIFKYLSLKDTFLSLIQALPNPKFTQVEIQKMSNYKSLKKADLDKIELILFLIGYRLSISRQGQKEMTVV